ncbi:MAG: outer membrane beta-barrel protein, partial [Verrucomicrobiota bacterium]
NYFMEKLNNRLLTTVIAAALVAITSSAVAGPGFRLSSKSPIAVPQKQHKAYFFGYGGFDSGADFDTTGNFDVPGYYHNGSYQANPTDIPINFDLQNGFTFGGGLGVYSGLLGGTRFEIEGFNTQNENGFLSYDSFELPADLDIETLAVMFNILKEIPLGDTGSTAYFGGGVGYATTSIDGDIDTIEYSDEDSGFAWQLIAGVDFPINHCLSLFTQYSYRVLADQSYVTDFGDFTIVTDTNPASHAVVFGARVSF